MFFFKFYSRFNSIAIGIEGLDCSKAARTNFVRLVPSSCTTGVFPGRDPFPIARGYKMIDTPVQSLYGLVLQSRPHSIPVALAIDCNAPNAGPWGRRVPRSFLGGGFLGFWNCRERGFCVLKGIAERHLQNQACGRLLSCIILPYN